MNSSSGVSLMPRINRQQANRASNQSPAHYQQTSAYQEDEQTTETEPLLQPNPSYNEPPINQPQYEQPLSQPISQKPMPDISEGALRDLQEVDAALKHVYATVTQADNTPVKHVPFASSMSIQMSMLLLWICLFLLFHTSTPLVLTFTIGTLVAYAFEIGGMSELGAIICVLSSVTLSLLAMFFHDIPSQLPTTLRILIVCTYLTSLLLLMIWFALRSPLLADNGFWKQRLFGELLLMAMLPVTLTMVSVMAIASVSQMDYSNIGFVALIIYLALIEICCIRPTVHSPDIVYWHAVFALMWPLVTHSVMHARYSAGQYFYSELLLLLSIAMLGLARLSYLHNRSHEILLVAAEHKTQFEKILAIIGLYGLSTGVTLRLVVPLLSTISWRVEHDPQFWSFFLVLSAWAACTSLVTLLSVMFVSEIEHKLHYYVVHGLFILFAAGMVAYCITGSLFKSIFAAIGIHVVEILCLTFIKRRDPVIFLVVLVAYLFGTSWAMGRSFGFLVVNFSSVLSLESVLILILMTAMIGFIAPVLPVFSIPLYSDIGRFGVVVYFALLTMCEMMLYQENGLFETAVWPWECVVLTSVIGLILARFLFTRGRIEAPVYAMLVCICMAKLGLLLIDTTLDFLQCAAIVISVILPALWPPQGKPRLIAHGAMIVISFWFGKNSVLAHVMALMGFDSANEATYLAAFLVAVSICLAPLTYLRASSPETRRAHLYLVIVTICYALTQPRLPGLLDSKSDILPENMHVANIRDWYLFLALALTSLNIVSLVPLPSMALAVTAGVLFGMYVAASIPFHFTVYVFFITICTVASLLAERVATAQAIPPRAAASRALRHLINGCLVLAYFAATTVNIGILEHSEWSALFLAPILIFTQPLSLRTFTIRFDRFMGILLAIYAGALPITLIASFVLFSDEIMQQVYILLLTLYCTSAIIIAVVGSIKQGTFLASSSPPAVRGKAIPTAVEGRYFVAAIVLSINLVLVALSTLMWSNYSFSWQLAQFATLGFTIPAAVAMVMSLRSSTSTVSAIFGTLALVCALIAAALTQLESIRVLAVLSAVVLFRNVVDNI